LPAIRVRLATAAVISAWKSVVWRPQYRACRTPSCIMRAIRCSTTCGCFPVEVRISLPLPRFLQKRLLGMATDDPATTPSRALLEAALLERAACARSRRKDERLLANLAPILPLAPANRAHAGRPSGGAGTGVGLQVDLELALLEALAVAPLHWDLGTELDAGLAGPLPVLAVAVGAVHRHLHRREQLALHLRRDAQLVAVEALARALPPLPHLRIADAADPLPAGLLLDPNLPPPA